MRDRKPAGIIFDMDGVLVDSADAHFESWCRLGSELGKDVTREQFTRTFGRPNNAIIPILFDIDDRQEVQRLADRKETIYRDLVRANPPIVEGAVQLVRELHDAGARLAVGSSAPRENIDLILGAMNVTDLIQVVVSAGEVTRGKPDPQVFSLACERLQLPPEQCVVIEDAPAGVEAAKRAGCQCIAVAVHHGPDTLAKADAVVRRLAKLHVDSILALAGGVD